MKKRALFWALVLLCLACFSAQAEVALSPNGYTLYYDPSAFLYTHAAGTDTFEWLLASGEFAARMEAIHADKAPAIPQQSEIMATAQSQATLVMADETSGALPTATAYVPDNSNGVWVFSLTWDPQAMSTAKDTLLNMVTTVCAGKKPAVPHAQCEICGHFYPEGNIFRNHICAGTWFDAEPGVSVAIATRAAKTSSPKARTTPKPSGSSQAGQVYCENCGKWYAAGNEFRNHICEPHVEYVTCDICGGTFEAGNVFRNHICTPKVEYVTCDICGGTFEAGNVFRNHICTPKVEYVTCDICGGTFEAGNVFRNHICTPKEP